MTPALRSRSKQSGHRGAGVYSSKGERVEETLYREHSEGTEGSEGAPSGAAIRFQGRQERREATGPDVGRTSQKLTFGPDSAYIGGCRAIGVRQSSFCHSNRECQNYRNRKPGSREGSPLDMLRASAHHPADGPRQERERDNGRSDRSSQGGLHADRTGL